MIGHVTDFIMDDKNWVICHLVVATGALLSGKEIVISPSHVDRIHYADSTVFVNLTKDAIDWDSFAAWTATISIKLRTWKKQEKSTDGQWASCNWRDRQHGQPLKDLVSSSALAHPSQLL
jgi:hypothetical protein